MSDANGNNGFKNAKSIEECIKIMARKVKPIVTVNYVAEVQSVDKTAGTVTVNCPALGITMDIPVHAAKPAELGKTFVVWPAVNSMVIIARIEWSDNFYLAGVITPEEVWLQGNKYSSVKTEELISEINKLKDSLDAIMSVISGVVINEPGSGSPSALQAALNAAVGNKTTGNFDDIANDKVKHGT